VRQHRPEVQPTLGDVRNLPFKDERFDGYWSLGVIEHFYDGYDEILREMHRVIRKDGYLFLTFPHMNRLRKIKAGKGLYAIWSGDVHLVADFYQFVLDECRVIGNFERNGFKLVYKRCMGGVKGCKDEIRSGRGLMQAIYDGRSLKIRLVRNLLDIFLRPWTSHMGLMVFKKEII
jgi:SAM-dependent methyltransferase